MVKNQVNRQYSLTANLQHHISNLGPLIPETYLWFQLSWGDLIIIPLIMVMLRCTLQNFHLNLTLNLLQIQTPIPLNQLVMVKCAISFNSSTQSMIKIFWVLTSRLFVIYRWLPLLQNFIQYLLCCFINMEEQMLQSQIACHTFYVCHNQVHSETS